MKKCVISLLLILFSFSVYAQEVVDNLKDTEIERRVASLDIEGETYENVVVTLKSYSPDFLHDKSRVKVTVVDSTNGETIWKKTFKSAYLFVFSDGNIQVGKNNFNQILISKLFTDTDIFVGKIREKEGIY
ncbi:MAG: hypothetical protein J5529_08590 [Prevotella sp.]|nr:hypothetical protein [Prevotella sp.]